MERGIPPPHAPKGQTGSGIFDCILLETKGSQMWELYSTGSQYDGKETMSLSLTVS